jgi:hypothetical protein
MRDHAAYSAKPRNVAGLGSASSFAFSVLAHRAFISAISNFQLKQLRDVALCE